MKYNNNKFIILPETDSTNNYANQLISEKTPENGTVVLAEYQLTGRGQRNNAWESAPGKNMLASIIVYPDFLPVTKQFYLSKITSLALCRWLSDITPNVSVKWPNDIYVGNKKIAGILIESSIQGNFIFSAIVGIGLNLNQTEFGTHLPNPVSLKMVTGNETGIIEAASELHTLFMELYEELKDGAFNEIDHAYFESLYNKNKWAWYTKENRLFEARIIGIGEYGQLLLEDRTGQINAYFFKEISFVI